MIRVDVGPRLSRSARRLSDQIVAEVEEVLTLVSRHFGEPHQHSGLGLRKLGRRSYEARVSRGLRIVFIRKPDRLTAYDLMDHQQVTQWLKERKWESATSGKAGGLTEVERLKAAWPFGRMFHRLGCQGPSPLCHDHRPEVSMHCLFRALHAQESADIPVPASRPNTFSPFPTLPELSNYGSLSGIAGGFPIGLKPNRGREWHRRKVRRLAPAGMPCSGFVPCGFWRPGQRGSPPLFWALPGAAEAQERGAGGRIDTIPSFRDLAGARLSSAAARPQEGGSQNIWTLLHSRCCCG